MQRWNITSQRRPFVTVGATPGQSWINIGPTNATLEYNGNNYFGFDTGRPTAFAIDPRDPNVVYASFSGGGVWKTWSFYTGAPYPTWEPITEGIPDLQIGAMALDPSNPDTIYIASGDAFDSDVGGNVYKSTNGGGSWIGPVTLLAPADYPAGTSKRPGYRPQSVRDLRVDPMNPNHVLAATRAGLFQSSDGGKSFTLTQLSNFNGSNGTAGAGAQSAWSIAWLGGSTWLVSGVTACESIKIPPRYAEPAASFCTNGAGGDIWRSTDAGATWTSLRQTAAALPIPAPLTGNAKLLAAGRITFAVGNVMMAPNTVVYAWVEGGSVFCPDSGTPPACDQTLGDATAGFWVSTNGGQTFRDATGTLANPTTASPMGGDCVDMNVGHNQAWYNQMIVVDPASDDHVVAGGNLCGVRTLNGTAAQPSWENVSHWLPIAGPLGATAGGALPYAHADWHTAAAVVVGGKTVVFSGNDGGVYTADNVFTVSSPNEVNWRSHNRGLVTQLMYALGSGEPTAPSGDGMVAMSGLQDNGTFLRTGAGTPTLFTGVNGGDGMGAAVNNSTTTLTIYGTPTTNAEIYWTSSEYFRSFCVQSSVSDCSQGGFQNASWWGVNPAAPFADEPFFVAFSPILTDNTGVGFLTQTAKQVWRTNLPAGADLYDCNTATGVCKLTWQAISPDFTALGATATNVIDGQHAVAAARKQANVYGVVLDGSNFNNSAPVAVTSDGGATWKQAAPFYSSAGLTLAGASALDFPNAPTPGKMPGDEFVAVSTAPALSDGVTPVPDPVGHIFATSDRGVSWTPINGNGGASPLPNVPITIVKFDPMTAKTIYVGTMIGVYVTRDGGATWQRLGSGLPFVHVTDLYVAANLDFVRITTYGRGMWELNPSATAPMGANGDGDYDLNGQIDWIDLPALSTRLGDTPATTTAPLYTWIDDLTGPASGNPVALIDDGDLAALLANFGAHP